MATTNSMTKSAILSGKLLSTSWETVGLVTIVSGALILRIAGIGSNLPAVIYNDEPFLIEHSLSMTLSDLNPHAFVWGTLQFHLVRMVSWAMEFLSSAIAGHPPVPGDYFLLARLISVGAGLGTVVLVFILGRLLAGTRAGLLSAALFAMSPFAVETAHYATVESTMAFWSTLALVGMALWRKGEERGSALAGVSAGLAMATKYNAAVLLVPMALIAIGTERSKAAEPLSRTRRLVFGVLMLVALILYCGIVLLQGQLLNIAASWTNGGVLRPVYVHIFDRLLVAGLAIVATGLVFWLGTLRNWSWPLRLVRTFTAASFLKPILLAIGVFLMVSPFVFLDFPAFVQGFFYPISKQVIGGLAGYIPGSRTYLAASQDAVRSDYLFYLRAILDDWGPFIVTTILIGLWALWKKQRLAFVPFASVILVELAVTATGNYQGTRYIYPIWGLLAVLGGLGIDWLLVQMNRRINDPRGMKAATGVMLVILFIPLLNSVYGRDRAYFLTPDTRAQALAWIERNIPQDRFILREWAAPDIELSPLHYHVESVQYLFETTTLAEWRAQGVATIVVEGFPPSIFLAHASEFQDTLAEYEKLKHEWKLMQSFAPAPNLKGPTVYIYSAP